MTNLERVKALRRELDELEPLNEHAARLLRNKVETFTRQTFPDDGRYVIAVMNVDFSPPDFSYSPMIEEDEIEEATLEKWAKAVLDLQVALDTMAEDPTIDAPRVPVSRPPRGSGTTTVSVHGNYNTVVAGSSNVNVSAPAQFPAAELRRLLAGDAQALKYVAAVEAEIKKAKPRAGVVAFAIEALKAIPVAAPVIGRWISDPASQTWFHHALVAAGFLKASP